MALPDALNNARHFKMFPNAGSWITQLRSLHQFLTTRVPNTHSPALIPYPETSNELGNKCVQT